MSSPPPFHESSPDSSNTQSRSRRKSAFTYRHLAQLSSSATSCPLRVIAHIDLDAFYAQCEMVRLGIPPEKPLAVQQWQGLIAINYPARKFGLNRHITCTEALKQCPDLILQHVATWKEGDEKWAYHNDSFKNMATHKVSLDPYRLESRKILALIKDILPPAPISKVEKASIDEVYLDLSSQVYSILLERFPMLKGPAPYDDPTEQLPRPPTTALEWQTDALVDLDESETEDDDPDWDDVAMLLASEIVRDVRAKIYETLKYTCSAGIARNKMLAKLGSAHKKPNQQTVVRNRAVHQFLSGFKFTKIRNLGGKLGDELVGAFNTDTVQDLLQVPIEQLRKQMGIDTGTWVYNIIRGEDHGEVNPRTQIKSMLSAKSFRPSINSLDTAIRWVRIFVADLFSRLVEEGVLENRRRPKTLNLYHKQGVTTRSKSAPIPLGRTMDESLLFDLAKNLYVSLKVMSQLHTLSRPRRTVVLDGALTKKSMIKLSQKWLETQHEQISREFQQQRNHWGCCCNANGLTSNLCSSKASAVQEKSCASLQRTNYVDGQCEFFARIFTLQFRIISETAHAFSQLRHLLGRYTSQDVQQSPSGLMTFYQRFAIKSHANCTLTSRLAQVIADGRAWPCATLSLSVSGFEDGVTGNKGIGGFLLRGEEAKAIAATSRESSEMHNTEAPPAAKRRRVDEGGIHRFFGIKEENSGGESARGEQEHDMPEDDQEGSPFEAPPSAQMSLEQTFGIRKEDSVSLDNADHYTCPRCNSFLLVTERGEHDDWHFAKDLVAEERANETAAQGHGRPSNGRPTPPPKSRGRGRPSNSGKTEKGQTRLTFG